jgi:DNA-binding response OmpR family regulator
MRRTPSTPPASPRLLVLDDEDAILMPLAHFFREMGYTVVTAREPEEAEALLDHQAFDLVILDLALTRFGIEGLEVLRSIRARSPWLPVIILSAHVSPEVESEARGLNVDAILAKPQPLRELARVASSVLGLER